MPISQKIRTKLSIAIFAFSVFFNKVAFSVFLKDFINFNCDYSSIAHPDGATPFPCFETKLTLKDLESMEDNPKVLRGRIDEILKTMQTRFRLPFFAHSRLKKRFLKERHSCSFDIFLCSYPHVGVVTFGRDKIIYRAYFKEEDAVNKKGQSLGPRTIVVIELSYSNEGPSIKWSEEINFMWQEEAFLSCYKGQVYIGFNPELPIRPKESETKRNKRKKRDQERRFGSKYWR